MMHRGHGTQSEGDVVISSLPLLYLNRNYNFMKRMDMVNVGGENKTLCVQHMPISGRIDGEYRAGEPCYLRMCMEPARRFYVHV